MSEADRALANNMRRIMDSAARAQRHSDTAKRAVQIQRMISRYFDAKVGKR